MPGLAARPVLSHVAAFAGDVIEAIAPEELGHLLFRSAGQDGAVVSVVAEFVFLVFAGELNVVPPNPFTGMNFANRDFDVVVFACHDVFSCGLAAVFGAGASPAPVIQGRGTIPVPCASLIGFRFAKVNKKNAKKKPLKDSTVSKMEIVQQEGHGAEASIKRHGHPGLG